MRISTITLLLLFPIAECWSQAAPKHGEVLPSKAMQEKYGLYCKERPGIRLSPKHVPADLVDLIPQAERWGISDDIIRSDCENLATPGEKRAFAKALRGRTAAVSRWLDSFKAQEPFTEERAAFMYMLEALDEMRLWPDQAASQNVP